ncbi:hypothetical protein [Parasitella parasitica]|uniref:Beta/gamma crystallin 'Greek key' domain-containing protein n=1 Tax=Parasitella parasitica TaxID=35722 RepID=A0A0B7NCE2_9FUNG|nr:hypothetical protein [Parasitella parasitica]
MKLLYFILIALVCALVHAQDGDSFQIDFYALPNYMEHNGEISGSVKPGEGAGTPRGNITVASFQAPTWLQVTLFESHYWGGKSYVYKGPQKKISPPVAVRSVKWKHL